MMTTASSLPIDVLPTVSALVQTARTHAEMQCKRLNVGVSCETAEAILRRVSALGEQLVEFFALYEETVTACPGRPLTKEESAELAHLRSILAEIQVLVSARRERLVMART